MVQHVASRVGYQLMLLDKHAWDRPLLLLLLLLMMMLMDRVATPRSTPRPTTYSTCWRRCTGDRSPLLGQ
ncbi:hypothetical protein FOA52_004685 [Chlamydomonas sp. UWO 241]|nr:hypothetical protein FOA52_004685 [Chlamydomonas sp. UWO 241]